MDRHVHLGAAVHSLDARAGTPGHPLGGPGAPGTLPHAPRCRAARVRPRVGAV